MIHFVVVCQKDKDPIRELMKIQAPHLLLFGNKVLDSIFGKFLSVCATFLWNFLDVFIMTLSIGLSTMFKLYNAELKKAKGEVYHFQYSNKNKKAHLKFFDFQNMSAGYWNYRRIQYGKLRDLVGEVDQKITQFTILSFANLLIFTCKQLFFGIRYLIYL